MLLRVSLLSVVMVLLSSLMRHSQGTRLELSEDVRQQLEQLPPPEHSSILIDDDWYIGDYYRGSDNSDSDSHSDSKDETKNNDYFSNWSLTDTLRRMIGESLDRGEFENIKKGVNSGPDPTICNCSANIHAGTACKFVPIRQYYEALPMQCVLFNNSMAFRVVDCQSDFVHANLYVTDYCDEHTAILRIKLSFDKCEAIQGKASLNIKCVNQTVPITSSSKSNLVSTGIPRP